MNASSIFAVWRTRALDDDADIGEGRGDRRVRLVHGDADAADLWELVEHRVGDRAGGGFDQAIAAGAECLTRRLHRRVVGHRVLELVGARGLGEVDVERQIEPEGLADLGLVLHHAVVGVEGETADEYRVAHRACRMAAATASACAVAATSWVRIMAAPCSAARRWAAIDPGNRAAGSDGTTKLMKRLRDAPTKIGRSKPRHVSSRAMQARLCSGVLPKPMPGSSTIRSWGMPALQAISSEREKKSVTSAMMSIAGSAASRLCITMTGAPCAATTRAMSRSRCRPHTSLTIEAPASSAQSATAAFIVSIDTGIPMAATAGRIGSRRARSSSGVTGCMPP